MLFRKKQTYKKLRFYPHPYFFFFSIPPPKGKIQFPPSPLLLGPSFNDAYKTRIAVCTAWKRMHPFYFPLAIIRDRGTPLETSTELGGNQSTKAKTRTSLSPFSSSPFLIPRFSNPCSTQRKCKLLRRIR